MSFVKSTAWMGALVLALGGALPGCKKKPQLEAVVVPDSGVALAYDLAAGQSYSGHIRLRVSLRTPVGDLVQALEFDVDMLATAVSDATKGRLVAATVRQPKLELRLPEGVPAAATGLDPEAAGVLDGMELRFNVSPTGEVTEMPDPPENAAPPIRAVIGLVTQALGGAFVRIPGDAVKVGATWDATSPETMEGADLERHSEGKLLSLVKEPSSPDELAKLAYTSTAKGTITREGTSATISSQSAAEVLFSRTRGFVTSIEAKGTTDAGALASQSIELKATFQKGAVQPVEMAPSDDAEVQAITDPCDADYVGGEECVEAPAPEPTPPASE